MKLNVKRTVLIGLAFMSILAFWQMYDQVIPYILENTFSLSTLQANSIMSVDNVLAIFMLPLFGAISDKTKSPMGKRTPFILFGTVIAAALLILLGVFTMQAKMIPFLVVLFLLLFTMSTYRTPAVAYMPDVTPKQLRSKGNAIINLVGYIGGIFSTILMMFLLKSSKNEAGETVYDAGQSFLPLFIIVASFMLFCILILCLTVRENALLKKVAREANVEEEADEREIKVNAKLPKDVMKSLILILLSVFLWFMAYNAVTTAFSRYCVEVLGSDLGTSSGYLLTATIAAIAAFVPLGHLSEKLGRKKTVLLGIVAMTICYLIAVFLRSSDPVIYVLFSVVGIGWAAINVNSYPMVVEMARDSNVGKYTGFYYTFSMAAQISTPLLSGFLIDHVSAGYKILFPYAVFFSAASFVTMMFVRHGDIRTKAENHKGA